MFAVVASISPLVQADDIVAARELLSDVISTTPLTGFTRPTSPKLPSETIGVLGSSPVSLIA